MEITLGRNYQNPEIREILFFEALCKICFNANVYKNALYVKENKGVGRAVDKT